MAKLDRSEPYDWARALAGAEDETVRRPLWEFPVEAIPAVQRERARRGYNPDPEQIGDHEYR
jgi:hypothetical protein